MRLDARSRSGLFCAGLFGRGGRRTVWRAGRLCDSSRLRRRRRRSAGLALSALTFLALHGEQGDRLLKRESLWIGTSRQRGEDPVMADIRPVTPAVQTDRAAAFGMLAELAHELRPAPALACGFAEQNDGSVQADGQYVIVLGEGFKSLSVLDVGAKPTDAGNDRLAGFRVQAQLARQCQKTQRGVEIDI